MLLHFDTLISKVLFRFAKCSKNQENDGIWVTHVGESVIPTVHAQSASIR